MPKKCRSTPSPTVPTPSAVRSWYQTHRDEGVHPDLAFRRAVERANCAGDISDAAAERLERALDSGHVDLVAADR